jgi:hypothetical protein
MGMHCGYWLALTGIILAGCSSRIIRHPVAPDLASQVHPVGMPADIPAWGDLSSADFQSDVGASMRRVRIAYGDQPPRDILTLSGGGANGAFGAGFLCGWTVSGKRPIFRDFRDESSGGTHETNSGLYRLL